MLHSHSHDHAGHHHDEQLKNINRTFIIGIALNTGYVIVEAVAGFATNSLALLSDAGHNLSDVAGLLISVLAFKLAEIKPTRKFTYGFSKLTVLAGMANAIILSVAVGSIGYSSIQRMIHPYPVDGYDVSLFALIGIFINGISAWLFMKQNQHDINIKGAYVHLMMDALISAGVVVAGVLIHFTDWWWLDPFVSLIIMVVILVSTWNLLKSTVRLSLDGVPENINMEDIKALKKLNSNIENLHHIHVWPISSSRNALTAHVLFKNSITTEQAEAIKNELKKTLMTLNIQHATLEMEYENCRKEEG